METYYIEFEYVRANMSEIPKLYYILIMILGL